MNIELRRYRFKSETVDGQIFIDGAKVCDCAENAHHCLPPGEYQITVHKCKQYSRKMPLICLDPSTGSGTKMCLEGTTAKRLGLRACSPEAKAEEPKYEVPGLQSGESPCLEGSTLPPCDACTKLPFVGNNTTLPSFCPMIKPSNGVYNRTDGSIIVGRYLAPGCLTHPKSVFDALYERIRKNAERGKEIILTIIHV